MSKKNKKALKLNNLKNKNTNLGEITIGEYLEDEVNKIMLKVKYGNDLTLDINDLIQNNITIQDIPVISIQENINTNLNKKNAEETVNKEIVDIINEKENITPVDNKENIKEIINISLSSQEEVAATEFLNLEAETKKRELNKYLEEENNFKEFDKKLVEIVRQPIKSKNSSFGKFISKFFLEEIRLFK